jgi:aryl-alcohol dehydrogenase-like predicted oxidoreductase
VHTKKGGYMKTNTSLSTYSLLGRSGLRVSPLALGTMTFGTEWGWGSPKETVFALMDRYLESGGNFFDTADMYTGGTSERMIGEYFADRGGRDHAVIATKFTFNSMPGDPNAGGNGRKNIYRALEGSLKRLRTDYVDLYWLHVWDGLTPVEEVMETLDALVKAGKVRYLGLSDVPAWYLSRAQTLAELRGLARLAGLQLEYSLVERNIEREHVPAALALGLGITPWSPLASGLLSGKYTRDGVKAKGQGRLPAISGSGNPGFEKLFTEQNWRIVDALVAAAKELGKPPAQVALSWVVRRPGATSTIIGATKLDQLETNLAALDVEIPATIQQKLDEISAPPLVHPYHFFMTDRMREMISGNTTVLAEQRGFRRAA